VGIPAGRGAGGERMGEGSQNPQPERRRVRQPSSGGGVGFSDGDSRQFGNPELLSDANEIGIVSDQLAICFVEDWPLAPIAVVVFG